VIGTAYGAGDGSTTFALPDLRGRTVAGIDNMGGTDAGRVTTSNTIGTATGSQTVVIGSSNLPPHTHTLNNHTHSGTTAGQSATHTHQQQQHDAAAYSWSITGGGASWGLGGTMATGNASNDHTHTVTTGGPSNNNTSDGGFTNTGLNVMQPTIFLNYIIKI
jgi:microcystin-dependent protein